MCGLSPISLTARPRRWNRLLRRLLRIMQAAQELRTQTPDLPHRAVEFVQQIPIGLDATLNQPGRD